ncbi:MAG: VanW family protein [Dethiobacteria bacterium]|nr:hypothetical protein [Bacillota bacterium]HOP69588.1 VanW family protein [Bacillota bacterium]HPT34517.1 VanW family protein [Bacillota bacterium]HQD06391.1 VanW family protein [Bacillota bacterium]
MPVKDKIRDLVVSSLSFFRGGSSAGRRWRYALAAIAFLAVALITVDYAYYRNRVYHGVYLEQLNLGGRPLKDLPALLERELWSQEEVSLELPDSQGTLTATYQEMGLAPDREKTLELVSRAGRGVKGLSARLAFWFKNRPIKVTAPVLVDEEKLAEFNRRLAEMVYRSPESARFQVEGEEVKIIPEREGRYLQAVKLRKLLIESIHRPERTLAVPTGKSAPPVTAEDLERLEVDKVMISFSTQVSGTSNRINNIRIGAAAVNGCLLAPGEVFSFSQVVGPATREKGYLEAPIIVGEELVPGLGGGLCQVSSTLYNAALLANLEILERWNHSQAVGYLPLGRDATIAQGLLDFKFVNNREHHILIGAELAQDRLTFRIFGPPMKERVEIISSGYQKVDPPVRYQKTSSLPKGEKKLLRAGKPGHYISTWRVVYMDDKEVSREFLGRDYYAPVAALYLLGTGEGEEAARDPGGG